MGKKKKKKGKKKLKKHFHNQQKSPQGSVKPEEINISDQKKYKEELIEKELEIVQESIDHKEEKIHKPYRKIVFITGSAFVALIVFTLLAVYGIFDIVLGISNRGPEHFSANGQNQELITHNTIVESINEMGNLTQEFIDEYAKLVPYGSFHDLKNIVIRFEQEKINLIKFIGTIELNGKQEAFKRTFYDEYLGVLDNWSVVMMSSMSIFENEGLTEESIAQYEEKVVNIAERYTNAHNSYIEVLNDNNKY